MSQDRAQFIERVREAHEVLGLGEDCLRDGVRGSSKQPLCDEATELVSVGEDVYGRPQRLAPAAARAWFRLQEAAAAEEVSLQLVSAFRGVDYQRELIERKLAAGQELEAILQLSAAPGFSEHHTGNAIDVTTEGSAALEVEFELSECFRWLQRRAPSFGFSLTYPRNNPFGIAYEPWHWCFAASEVKPPADPESCSRSVT